MDIPNGSARSRNRKISTPTERFLGAFSYAPHLGNPSSRSSSVTTISSNGADDDNELNEDDVFWTGDYSSESNHQNHNISVPPSFSSPRNPQHSLHRGFAQHETFGILAALPENEASTSLRNGSHFYHKASISSSSSSSSSSRLIPTIPRLPLERTLLPNTSYSSSLKYQSAPVKVPMMRAMRRNRESDVDDDVDEEGDGELLPPHEIVSRRSAQTPVLACSVLEGAGRTLKGRDLRQVRNAIWRQTGFLD